MELPIFHPICTHLCRCAMRPHFHTFVCVTIAQVRNLFGPLVRNGPKFFLYFWQFSLKKWSKWHRWLILQDKNFWNKFFWSGTSRPGCSNKKNALVEDKHMRENASQEYDPVMYPFTLKGHLQLRWCCCGGVRQVLWQGGGAKWDMMDGKLCDGLRRSNFLPKN